MINSAKICAIGIACAIICVILRQYKNELVIPTRIAGIITAFGITILMISPIIEYIRGIFDNSLPFEYLEIVTKALGIAYLTQIGSEVCHDCGESNIGVGIETAGKLELLLLALPLFNDIILLTEDLLSW